MRLAPLLHPVIPRPALWSVAVLAGGLVLDATRWHEGPVVVVIDERCRYGLHRMDVIVIAVALAPWPLVLPHHLRDHRAAAARAIRR